MSACSTASLDGFTRRRTGIASMNMHSISCHFFSEMENKIPAWDANAPLHIGSSITLGTCLLPSLVKAYQEQRPEIKIYVTSK
mgnify:CR=1 FL=1